MSLSLKLLGGAALRGESGPITGPAVQRHRLALLALLAASHPRALSRDKLIAWLWPERESEPARHLLNQAVHALRQALGADAIVSAGDELQLDATVVDCDVVDFEAALAEGRPEQAAALYAGPFLDGFFLGDAPEFERWVDRERDRLAASYARAVEGLADAAEGQGNSARAVEWWRARAANDPYDSRVALRLMHALERAGNRAGALQHAATHQRLLRDELGIEPPGELLALVERLRREPVPAPRPAGVHPPRPAASTPTASTPTASTDAASADTASGPVAAPATSESPGSHDSLVPATRAAPLRRRAVAYVAAAVLLAGAAAAAVRLAPGRNNAAAVQATPKVVDEIAQAVARELSRRERGDTAARLPQHRTRSIPAYELYLRGSDPALLRSDSGARRGLEYFRRAVALDSTYAAAWAGLARMSMRVAGDSPSAARDARAQAEAAARKSVALDDSLAEGYATLGVLRSMAYDFASAEQDFRHAIDLAPTQVRLREWFANFQLLVGHPAEGLAEAERALALDPRSPSATAEVARALLANDRCDEALARLEAIAALDPPLLRAVPIAAQCYGRMGRWARAIELLRPPAAGGDPLTAGLLGYMLARSGQREEARSIQARLQDRNRTGDVAAFYLLFVPAGLGDRDQAFAWLDRAYDDGSLGFGPGRVLALTGPPFDELRQDPRWGRLRERLGLQNR